MSIFGGSGFLTGGGGGGAQGVIRYQVLVDSQQATQQVNSFKQSLTSVGSPVANATKNVTGFNTTLNTLSSTLKTTGTGIAPINQNLNQFNATMKQTTSQFNAGITPIKQTGDAMANYQKNLAATGTAQKSIGTQVKDIASKYSTFAIGMGSTVSQVVNLARQYRDLVDTQIAVDRTARKMSLAQEAVDKTTAKLNALQAKGIHSGTEYNNALRDQQQALAQLKIATDVHDEALERQGDTYMNFATQVIPTAITAVGTLGSAFKDLGVKSSTFTGVLGKMKGGVGGIVSTLAGFVTQLFGVGTAGTAAGVGTTAAAGGIKAVDASSKTAAIGVKGLAGALGLLAIPLAGLTFFLELKKVNEDLEKQLNKTSKSVIDSSKDADQGYTQFMKNMRTETKATHDMMSKDVPFVKELGDAVGFVTGMFPGLNEWIVKTSNSMDDAVISGDLQHRSLAEIALGIGDVTTAGQKNATQTKTVTQAQNDLTAAQKNYNDMLGFGTDAQVAAAKAQVDKAQADLNAAKATGISNTQLKDFGKTISVLNPKTGQYTETIEKASAAHEGFGQSSGEVDDALKKNGASFVEIKDVFGSMGEGFRQNAIDLGLLPAAINNADPIFVGFGTTIGNLQRQFGALKKAAPIKFPTADVLASEQGIASWGNTAKTLTAPQIAALKKLNDEYAISVKAAADQLKLAKDSTVQMQAENNELMMTFGGLNQSVLTNMDLTPKLLELSHKKLKGHEAEEVAILDLAAANDVYSSALVNLADKEGDQVTEMNNILASTIDYTSALTDMDKQQKLISEGFRDGIIQAKGFFDQLVKNSEQTAQFNAAVAEGAYELGINSDMLAFTSSKAQELITSVYDMEQGYNDMSIAAAKNTQFLKDGSIVMAQREKGMLEGIQSANDWTASMIKDTAATKANHDQMVVLAKQMGIMNDLTGKSTEEIQTMMQAANGDTDAIKKLADAANAAAKDFASLADAANQRLTTVLKIKVPDADKELKKMIKDLPKSAQKEIELNVKFAGNAKAMKENFNTMLETGAQTSDKTADAIAKDMIEKLNKGFKKGGGEKAFPGLQAQLEAAIASPDTPSALYKILKEYNWDGVGVNLPPSIQKDLDGVILNPTIEAEAGTGTQLSKDIQAQMNQNPITVPITPISLGSITSGVSNEFAKLVGAGTTQTVKILGDNTDALAKVDAVKTAITNLGKEKPQIALMNNNAKSAIDTTEGFIRNLEKVKPQISLLNKNAKSAIDSTETMIRNLEKVKPQISLQNKNAKSAVDAVEGWIRDLGKVKPQISLQNRNAFNAVDAVKKEIMKLETLHPSVTVKVKYDTSAKPPGTEKVTGGEVVGAERLSERTDIMGADSKGFVHARGTEALQVNLYNYNNDRETLRTFKRQLGKERYTMGI